MYQKVCISNAIVVKAEMLIVNICKTVWKPHCFVMASLQQCGPHRYRHDWSSKDLQWQMQTNSQTVFIQSKVAHRHFSTWQRLGSFVTWPLVHFLADTCQRGRLENFVHPAGIFNRIPWLMGCAVTALGRAAAKHSLVETGELPSCRSKYW